MNNTSTSAELARELGTKLDHTFNWMDCRRALAHTDNNLQAAADWLTDGR